MRRRSFLAGAAALPLGAAGMIELAGPAAADTTTVIDPRTKRGTWQGWGTSLCWWAKAFGDRDDLAELTFSQKTVTFNGQALPGLGMNIARYNAGACSTNAVNGLRMVSSANILASRKLDGFWLDPGSTNPASSSWNWSVDANQRGRRSTTVPAGA